MGKYSKFEKKTAEAQYKIHPVWSGIGFLMIIVVPITAWAAAMVFVEFAQKQGWAFINSFPMYLQLPSALNSLPGADYLSQIVNLPVTAILFVLILFILSGVLSFAYAAVYRIIGPPRYTSQDVPAPRIKTQKYKR